MKYSDSQTSDDALHQQICSLEQALLMGPERYDPDFLARTLHADFKELDARGNTTQRADAVKWLLTADPDTQWHMQDFSLQQVTHNVVISHYRAYKTNSAHQRNTLHSGVWCQAKGGWQLVFHQGTYAPE